MLEKLKIFLAVAVIGVAVFGYYFFEDHSILLRVIGVLLAIVIAAVIFYQAETGKKTFQFIQDSRAELRKVVWPTKKETLQTTGLVIAMVVVIAVFLWVLDMILLWSVKLLTGQGA